MPSRIVEDLIKQVAALQADMTWIKRGMWLLGSGIVTVVAQNYFK